MDWTPQKTNLPPIERAKQNIQALTGEIDAMVEAAKAIVINDDKSQNTANSMAGLAKKINKDIEARRKEIIKPQSEFVKKVNTFAKLWTDKLKTVWTEVDSKDYIYHSQKELERRKQEELIRKANEELQKKLNAEAKKSGVAAPTVMAKPLPKPDLTVRTEEGSSYWRDNWVGEIKDPAKVPVDFCSPDQSKINAAVKQGIREIPGVLIENRKIKSYRT